MSIEVRIQKLLVQIETESFRLCRVESHPAFKSWLSKEPRLGEGLVSVRKFWKIFCDDASHNDPLIPQYIEQLEKATSDLAQSLDLMYTALGFEEPNCAQNPN
ncbi:MAG: hypothetical protein KatS3mg070_1056 [Meiothermus sp.]|uniref:hypothetical protein n=1 Tax=Meiothermus sp. TaxID=1955249 RepID=UPI0021DE1FFD|nr:hypothetical protein [Meiothermus sp.]GIW27693.1 MAG: hypothetical protein KatS3mg070_1056 [Meiothermus sp.]